MRGFYFNMLQWYVFLFIIPRKHDEWTDLHGLAGDRALHRLESGRVVIAARRPLKAGSSPTRKQSGSGALCATFPAVRSPTSDPIGGNHPHRSRAIGSSGWSQTHLADEWMPSYGVDTTYSIRHAHLCPRARSINRWASINR